MLQQSRSQVEWGVEKHGLCSEAQCQAETGGHISRLESWRFVERLTGEDVVGKPLVAAAHAKHAAGQVRADQQRGRLAADRAEIDADIEFLAAFADRLNRVRIADGEAVPVVGAVAAR